jgi:hypothetical protein
VSAQGSVPARADDHIGRSRVQLAVVTSTKAADGMAATIALVSDGWRSLGEARGLPEIRRVLEAAAVAEEAARRVARLAEAEPNAAAIVAAAVEAANDAAALRIEAQARAGDLLRQMASSGERDAGGQGRIASRPAIQLADLGITLSQSSRWQQVSAIPAETRRSYVEETKAAGGEVTTAGLLRHAAQARPSAKGIDHAAIHAMAQRQIRQVHRGLTRLHTYRPDALVAALKPKERDELTESLPRLRAWVADVEAQLAAHRPRSREVR